MFPTDLSADDVAELADLATIRSALAGVGPAASTTVLAGQIRGLRELACMLAAAEASVTAAFVAGRRAEQVAAGMPARRVGHGIGSEVALARRESPNRAGRYVGFATVMTRELPCTLAAMRAGETTEWRAMLIARETGWLRAEDRAGVDADLGPRLHALGDPQVEAEAARLAYAADPRGKIRAIERAAGGRHVSVQPAPDGQCRLHATLPLAQGVAAYAALCREAEAARAAGDERGRGQLMADTLIERVTGQTHAELVPLTVNLIMTDDALVNSGPGADEPATVSGHGPIPAPFARQLITRTAESEGMVRIRRLFTDPVGRLVSMETGSRVFTPAMAEFVRLRDQRCTTPYCGAPIRHIDHVRPWAQGGPTTLTNAAGLCEACNYAKQAPGRQPTTQADGSSTMPGRRYRRHRPRLACRPQHSPAAARPPRLSGQHTDFIQPLGPPVYYDT